MRARCASGTRGRSGKQEDARIIQRSLLPQSLPTVPPFSLGAHWRPASGYGGDWYDVSVLGTDVVGVAIADVAGKGLPAALLMSNLQAAVRAFWHPEAPPRQLCESVNQLLCRHMVNGRFVTFCAVRLDCRTRTLTWANAGHNPPLVVRATGEVVRLQPGGTVMGVFEDAAYQRGIDPARAPAIASCSIPTGLRRRSPPAGDEFGEEGLLAAINAHAGAGGRGAHGVRLRRRARLRRRHARRRRDAHHGDGRVAGSTRYVATATRPALVDKPTEDTARNAHRREALASAAGAVDLERPARDSVDEREAPVAPSRQPPARAPALDDELAGDPPDRPKRCVRPRSRDASAHRRARRRRPAGRVLPRNRFRRTGYASSARRRTAASAASATEAEEFTEHQGGLPRSAVVEAEIPRGASSVVSHCV